MLKKELRILYRKKREELSADDIQKLSSRIENNLIELLSKLQHKNLNCFLTSVDKKEVNTSSIINKLFDQNKHISVPVSNYQNNTLLAAILKKDAPLSLDQFGIPTPEAINTIDPKSIDIVIVPLLCFDKKGYRCGYGKGMYDRFLSTCKKDVITIGLSFFDPIKNITDVNNFDIPLDYVINAKTVYHY